MGEFNKDFMQMAIDIATDNVVSGKGGPFGALVVKEGRVISRGVNKVTCATDPTAHAEITAIREACFQLGDFELHGCDIYSSCEPCPMCLGAIYWARPEALFFAASRQQAAEAGFDDEMIYEEINTPPERRKIFTRHINHSGSLRPFEAWVNSSQKIPY